MRNYFSNLPFRGELQKPPTYDHLKITLDHFRAQRNLVPQQGENNLWLAGLYMHDIDCHESAIMSAVNIAQKLDPQSDNLRQLME